MAEAARAHGKAAGTMATPETVPALVAEGYRFLNLGADVLALGAYCRQQLEAVRR